MYFRFKVVGIDKINRDSDYFEFFLGFFDLEKSAQNTVGLMLIMLIGRIARIIFIIFVLLWV